jgi:hypothetical protein
VPAGGSPIAGVPPPRLYVLPARKAPVAIVLRRGPSEWFHILRWHLDDPRLEPGAWLHGTLYPRRCSISPDGRLLAYFALTSRPPPWDAYHAVSRAPWLTALAAWHVGSTWTAGLAFADDGALLHARGDDPAPSHGRYPGPMRPLPPPSGAGRTPFDERDVANEFRRGWTPADAGSPHVAAGAVIVLRRARPGTPGDALLLVHRGHRFGAPNVEGARIEYLLESDGEAVPLAGIVWADWDARGRLLVAGADGSIAIRHRAPHGWEVLWRHDLGGLAPDPQAPPEWATRW